jgi:hypothetical protein
MTNYVVDCRVEKLNRVIRITGDTLKNKTTGEVIVQIGENKMHLKSG